jgi:hypothetical protein
LARLTAAAGAAAIVLVATLADAGRPLDTEDTTVLDPGAAEVEAGLELSRGDDGRALGGRLVAAVGVFPGLEARIEASVLASDPRGQSWRAGAGDSLIGLKYRLLADSSAAPAVLLAAAARLPTGDDTRGLGEGTPAVVALAAVSRRWGPLTLTANAGYVFEANGRADDAVLAALAAERQLAFGWTLVGEVFALLGVRNAADQKIVARVGAAWQLGRNLRLDGAVGTGLGFRRRESPAHGGGDIPILSRSCAQGFSGNNILD